MDQIQVSVERLRKTLAENLRGHNKAYHEAREGWMLLVREGLEAQLEVIRQGETPDLLALERLEKPVSYVKAYEQAIQMLMWHEGEQIALSQAEFRQFVQDDWHWKRQWHVSNASYLWKFKNG